MLKNFSQYWLLIVLSFVVLAAESRAECALDEPQCVAENQWQLGIAIGIGVKQNPLQDGDNIPLVLLPDIAWYGESAYFDNGELGYQLYNDNNFAMETFVSINDERAYFSFWHPTNILFSQFQLSNSIAPENGGDFGSELDATDKISVSIKDIGKRKWALDAGLRVHYWQGDNQWQVSLKQDVSSVHKGMQASLSYLYHWQSGSWSMSLKPQLQWKSSKLLDYYYGLDATDNVDIKYFYQATSGWFSTLTLLAVKPFAEDWSILFKASATHLADAMSDSPIVNKDNIISAFIGVAHRF